jgi:hypothetical protein
MILSRWRVVYGVVLTSRFIDMPPRKMASRQQARRLALKFMQERIDHVTFVASPGPFIQQNTIYTS